MRKSFGLARFLLPVAVIFASLGLVPAAHAATGLKRFAFQGVVTSLPDGVYDMDVQITGGKTAFNTTVPGVQVTNGVFSLLIDANRVDVNNGAELNHDSFYSAISSPNIVANVTVKNSGGGVIDQFNGLPMTSVPSAYVAHVALGIAPEVIIPSTQISGLVNSATNANNFTGSLSGDVTGNQGTTSVEKVRGLSVPASSGSGDGNKYLRLNSGGTSFVWDAGGGGGSTYYEGTGLTLAGTTFNVNVGTSANKIVQLNGSGQIPAAILTASNLPVLNAGKLDPSNFDATSIGAGTINSSHIADGTVGAADLALGGVSTQHLAPSSVKSAQLDANSVTDSKINDVSASKINAGTLSNAYLPSNIDVNTVAAGNLDVKSGSTVSGGIRFKEPTNYTGNNTLTLKLADADLASNMVWNLPAAAPASNNQILKFDNTTNTFYWAPDDGGASGNDLTGTGSVSVSGGVGAVLGAGASISVATASGSTNGILTKNDWAMFNAKADGSALVAKAGDTMTGILGVGTVMFTGSPTMHMGNTYFLRTEPTGELALGKNSGNLGGTLGYNGVYIGSSAGANSTGQDNTIVGYFAGTAVNANVGNSYFGTTSGMNASGGSNTFMGYASGKASSGFGNVAMGSASGLGLGASNAATLLGASSNVTGNVHQATALGYGAVVSAGSAVQIGAGQNSTPDTMQFSGWNFLDKTGLGKFSKLTVTPPGMVGEIKLGDNDGTANYLSLRAPNTVTANVTWTLPAADGSNGQALTTDGGGNLGWASVPTVASMGAIAKAGDSMTGVLGLMGPNTSPSRVLVLNSNREVVTSGNVDVGELDSLDGVTGNIGDKLNRFNAAEASYLAGTTGPIQAGLTSKLSKSGGTMTGDLDIGSANITMGGTTFLRNRGPENTILGYAAGANLTGDYNTLLGKNAGGALTSGTNNTVVGYGSTTTATTTDAVALGANSTVVADSVAVGVNANVNGNFAVAVGRSSGASTANSVALGAMAVSNANSAVQLGKGTNATQESVQFMGWNFLDKNGNANFNNVNINGAINGAGGGNYLAKSGGTMTGNLDLGTTSLKMRNAVVLSNNPDNTMVGAGAGQNLSSGVYNVAVGIDAGNSLTGGSNSTFVGYRSGTNATGMNNTALGYMSGYALAGGNYNTLVGDGVATALTTGSANVVMGSAAAIALTTGASNVVIGNGAGASITAGSNNVVMGNGANSGAGSAASGNTAIGANAVVTGAAANNTVLGKSATASIGAGGVAIGYASTMSASTAVAIGQNATASGAGAIALGAGASATVATAIQLGRGANAIPGSLQFLDWNFLNNNGDAKFSLVSMNAVMGGVTTGTDKGGAPFYVQSGQGTGAAPAGSIEFKTSDSTSSGSTQQAFSTKMIIKGGKVGIGTTNPSLGHDLTVANAALATQWVAATDGSLIAPSFQWASDSDTGLFKPATNEVGIASDGTEVAKFTPNGVIVGGGNGVLKKIVKTNMSFSTFGIASSITAGSCQVSSGQISIGGVANNGNWFLQATLDTDPAYAGLTVTPIITNSGSSYVKIVVCNYSGTSFTPSGIVHIIATQVN